MLDNSLTSKKTEFCLKKGIKKKNPILLFQMYFV